MLQPGTAQTEPVARCPVSGATALASGKATCPFAAAATAPSDDGIAFTAVPQDRCPFGFGPAAAESAKMGPDAQPKAIECPMGFGSAKTREPTAALTCTRLVQNSPLSCVVVHECG